jgi:spore maturation protein SpmA
VFARSGSYIDSNVYNGYRAAENATNPADVMLPCIITSFIGTIAAFIVVGIRQRVNFKVLH